MTHVTCRLTAKNRDQLRNPTLGNRVWAALTFLTRPKQVCVQLPTSTVHVELPAFARRTPFAAWRRPAIAANRFYLWPKTE